jgi:hypothetical protein
MKGISPAPFKLGIKSGSFTRDTALASGTQTITGLGIKPKGLIFFAVQSSTNRVSWGIDDKDYYSSMPHLSSTDLFGINAGSKSIHDNLGYEGYVVSFGDDSFTIQWARTGTPTGILYVIYFAIGEIK